jgi:hypothetical protein
MGVMKVGWEMGRECIWFRVLSNGGLNLQVLPNAFSHCGVVSLRDSRTYSSGSVNTSWQLPSRGTWSKMNRAGSTCQ